MYVYLHVNKMHGLWTLMSFFAYQTVFKYLHVLHAQHSRKFANKYIYVCMYMCKTTTFSVKDTWTIMLALNKNLLSTLTYRFIKHI